MNLITQEQAIAKGQLKKITINFVDGSATMLRGWFTSTSTHLTGEFIKDTMLQKRGATRKNDYVIEKCSYPLSTIRGITYRAGGKL